jgi:hypothetical protein
MLQMDRRTTARCIGTNAELVRTLSFSFFPSFFLLFLTLFLFHFILFCSSLSFLLHRVFIICSLHIFFLFCFIFLFPFDSYFALLYCDMTPESARQRFAKHVPVAMQNRQLLDNGSVNTHSRRKGYADYNR